MNQPVEWFTTLPVRDVLLLLSWFGGLASGLYMWVLVQGLRDDVTAFQAEIRGIIQQRLMQAPPGSAQAPPGPAQSRRPSRRGKPV